MQKKNDDVDENRKHHFCDREFHSHRIYIINQLSIYVESKKKQTYLENISTFCVEINIRRTFQIRF